MYQHIDIDCHVVCQKLQNDLLLFTKSHDHNTYNKHLSRFGILNIYLLAWGRVLSCIHIFFWAFGSLGTFFLLLHGVSIYIYIYIYIYDFALCWHVCKIKILSLLLSLLHEDILSFVSLSTAEPVIIIFHKKLKECYLFRLIWSYQVFCLLLIDYFFSC